MPHLSELKQRLSESRAKRVWTLPSVSCFNRARALLACYQRDARRLNNHNTAKRMTETFGHSDYLITLSLSLSLSGARLNNTYYFTRGSPASIYGFSCIHTREVGLFFCPRRTTAAGTATDARNNHLTEREQNKSACFAERENGRMKCKQF